MIKQLLSMSRSMMQTGLETMQKSGAEQMPRLHDAMDQMLKTIREIETIPDLTDYTGYMRKMVLGLQKVIDGHNSMVSGYKLAIEAVDDILMFVESVEATENKVSN